MDAANAIAEFTALGERLERVNLRETMVTLRQMQIEDTKKAFATATSPDGRAWVPRIGNDNKNNFRNAHPLLYLTGAMFRAATGQNAGSARGIGDNSIECGVLDGNVGGNGVFYAKYQQHGTNGNARNKGRPGIPARPFIGMSEVTIDEGAEVVADSVMGKVFSNG